MNEKEYKSEAKASSISPCKYLLWNQLQTLWKKTRKEKIELSALHNWSFNQTTSRGSSSWQTVVDEQESLDDQFCRRGW